MTKLIKCAECGDPVKIKDLRSRRKYCLSCTEIVKLRKGNERAAKSYRSHKKQPYKKYGQHNWRLVKCPEDSWGHDTRFATQELEQSLLEGVFFPGTEFYFYKKTAGKETRKTRFVSGAVGTHQKLVTRGAA